MRIMNIKRSSCCDLVEQKVNFWFTNSGELVIESEILSKLYEYIDDIAESYFKDYCAGLFTSQELDRFVE